MPGENEKVQAFAPQGIENAGVDISFTVPANGWSENSPYTYTWTNSNILSNSRVTVGFASGNSSTDVVYLDCEKVTGGVQLTSSVKPSAALYLVAHIINAKMDSYADVHGDMVATDVITGASNVDEALEDLDSRVDTLNSNINTVNTKLNNTCYSDITNATSYTIPLTGHTFGSYWIALMYIQTGVSSYGLYIIFMNTSDAVTVTPLISGGGRTFTGVRSGNNIVLTANDTVWGGIRVLMMN